MEGVYYTEGVYWRGASYGLVHTEWLKGAFIRQEAFIWEWASLGLLTVITIFIVRVSGLRYVLRENNEDILSCFCRLLIPSLFLLKQWDYEYY